MGINNNVIHKVTLSLSAGFNPLTPSSSPT
jgi:hypothetical protein